MPDRACVLQPDQVLAEPLKSNFLNTQARVLDRWDCAKPAKFCFRVTPEDELILRLNLLRTGIAGLICEGDAPTFPNGRPLVAGLFCVPRKPGSDRFIFDRRLANAGKTRLNWAILPYGPQLCRIIPHPSECARGFGGDLRSFFYQLSNAPEPKT